MYFWERRNFIFLILFVVGSIILANQYNAPQPALDGKIDKLANYLYSAPVILKKIKTFFAFADLPIKFIGAPELTTNQNKPSNLIAANPRGNLIPSPSPSPVAKKANIPKDKSGDPSNYGTRFVVEKYGDDPNKDAGFDESGIDETTTPGSGGGNQANAKDQKINDWTYKLFMNPTKDNMNSFIQEYQTGRITKDIFYGVLKALVDGTDERTQYIGIYGLTAVPSFESFEMLAIKVDEKTLRKENQTLAQRDLDHYASPENIKILVLGLKSSKEAVSLQSLQSVNLLLERKQMVGGPSNSPTTFTDRERRGTAASQMNKGSYIEISSAIQNLTQSKNHHLAILAENTLQSFRESVNLRPEYVENETQQNPPSRFR
jgi:hypothetical protein